MKEIKSIDEYEKKLEKEKKPIFIDFYAKWCSPCKMIAPIIDSLSTDYSGKMCFMKVDIEECPELAEKYKVKSVPTLIIVRKEKTVSSKSGYRDKSELERWIREESDVENS